MFRREEKLRLLDFLKILRKPKEHSGMKKLKQRNAHTHIIIVYICLYLVLFKELWCFTRKISQF